MAKTSQHGFEHSVMPWLGKTGKMMSIFMADKFKQHGLDLSVEQFVILKILHEENGLPQNDMALVTERHKASLTRLLDNMEKKHLVVRTPDPHDGRVKRVYLTKHGRGCFKSTLPVLKEATGELQKGLTKTEVKTLISILKKVLGNMNSESIRKKGCGTN